MQRNHVHVEKPDYSWFLMLKLTTAALATLLAHPVRVLLNHAAIKSTPQETWESARPVMFKDIPLNMMRGTIALGLQSIVKHYAHLFYGHDTWQGQIVGIAGAGATGTFTATFAEVPFMRKNAIHAKKQTNHSLWHTNKYVMLFFAVREYSFSVNVFGTSESPWYIRGPLLLGGAFLSAVPQKLVSIEVLKDIYGITDQVPDFRRQGIRKAFRNIGLGNIYTHESLQVLYLSPVTKWQQRINFMNATCGPNMFFFRLVFLIVFGEALKISERLIIGNPDKPSLFGLFQHQKKPDIKGKNPASSLKNAK